jgi:hypothetical protein
MKATHLKQQQKINNMKATQTTRPKNNTNNIRVQNNTNIQFTQDEIQLLNKGIIYPFYLLYFNYTSILTINCSEIVNGTTPEDGKLVPKHVA